MKVNPLPPQAYTKETLQKAYTWLLNQSASVKDMATTQDMLVSLYLKAQRNGEESLETPSILNFKKELKNLASMIGDLQPTEQMRPQTKPMPMTTPPTAPQPQYSITTPPQAEAVTNNNGASLALDSHSLQIINEIKYSLNLSSETEALRALVALGYKQFKKMN